jgi:hypothetical protein
MTHKLGICIPYRNRKEHIERLIPHLSKELDKQGIEHTFYVGHQVDDKLFNRGAMKNIAAHYAFEDGCDYIAWHDVDMLVFNKDEDGVSYAYPEDKPLHIATKLSKYNYGLGYDQYFGGVVLFTKDQAYQTNGYSNEYWDWGQEDDDLFWRCYYEGLTTGNVYKQYLNKSIGEFNGDNSYLTMDADREISACLHSEHTISILFNAEQQPDKVPIWLVGDPNRKFIEYPLLRKDGSWTWGASFNNSRAVSMVYFDKANRHHYNYGKRFEHLWTWLVLSYSKEHGGLDMYINNEKINLTTSLAAGLKSHDSIKQFLIGFCNHTNTYYKGKIADIKIFDRYFDNVEDVLNAKSNIILNCDFENMDNIGNNNVKIIKEDIEVIGNIIPYRREGKFYCLPHIDEGFVNGTWAKGETTARNEKRFVSEMQQRKIDYKNDGLKNVLDTMDIESIDDTLYPKTKFLNVKMK